MRGFLLFAVLAVGAAAAITWYERRSRDRPLVVRDLRGGRRVTAVVAGLVGWAGASTCAGWLLVHFPGRWDVRDLPPQPAPAWLWQLGLPVAVVGGVIAAGLALRAPAASELPPLPSRRAERQAFVALHVATVAPLVLASAVAEGSELRAAPLLLAAVALGASALRRLF